MILLACDLIVSQGVWLLYFSSLGRVQWGFSILFISFSILFTGFSVLFIDFSILFIGFYINFD